MVSRGASGRKYVFGIGFTEILVNILIFILIAFAIRWAVSGSVQDAAKKTGMDLDSRSARRISTSATPAERSPATSTSGGAGTLETG